MTYILIVVGLIILSLCVFLVMKKKKIESSEDGLDEEINTPIERPKETEMIVDISKLENPQIISPKRKHEVKDPHLLGLVSSAIPVIAQGLTQTAQNNALRTQLGSIKNVYTVTLESGGELYKSKIKKGVYQAVRREHGKIKEHADLRKVDLSQQVSSNFKNLVNVANVMQVASMVVGQYYMSEIDNKISALDEKLDQIQNFLENALVANLKKDITVIKTLSEFSTEIFNNKGELNRRLSQIDRIEEDLLVIIAQVNAKLKDLTEYEKMSFKNYTERIAIIDKWQNMQAISVAALIQASQLKVLLTTDEHFDDTYHTSLLDKTMVEIDAINQRANDFHETLDNQFGIDFETAKRRVDIRLVSRIMPRKKVGNSLLTQINQQKSLVYTTSIKEIQFAKQHNVQMIMEDGKLYYVENEKELVE